MLEIGFVTVETLRRKGYYLCKIIVLNWLWIKTNRRQVPDAWPLTTQLSAVFPNHPFIEFRPA